MIKSRLLTWEPPFLSILRIVTAVLFFEHGTQKLFGFPPSDRPTDSMSLITGGLEFFGGASLIAGLFTRPVAFLLSGMMAVAYWIAHAPKGMFPVLNGGDTAILYCFVFLYLVFAGSGPWSIDEWRKKGER
jgi:putative oxidoreductase